MDLDDYADAFFLDPPPLALVVEGNYNALNALSDVIAAPSLSEAVAELHLQLGEQYIQGRMVIDNGITSLREQHEQELSNLLATAGRDVALVHSDTMESVIMRQKREIDDALLEREELRVALERELRDEFVRFIVVSSSGLDGATGVFPKCATSLIGYGVSVPCSTVKIPNPLRGVLVGARPKDPALSAIVLDVSPISALPQILEIGNDVERHKEHLRRLSSHRHSVLLLTDAGFNLPTTLPELLLAPFLPGSTVDGFDVGCCTNLWGSNVIMRPSMLRGSASGGVARAREPMSVDGFRRVLSFAVAISCDMLSFVLGRDHLESELLNMIEAVAATQIDIGASRLTNAWTVSLSAVAGGQSDVIQNQPVYSAHKQPFNLALTLRVFIPPPPGSARDDMSEIKRFFHRVLEGRGLEWTGE